MRKIILKFLFTLGILFSSYAVVFASETKLDNISTFSKVLIHTTTHGESIRIRLAFYGVITPSSNGKKSTFRIGIDGNLKKGEFHAISLDDSFQIPKSLAYKGMIGKFYIAEHSVRDNSFRNLYNSLSLNNQTKLQGACEYIKAKVSDILKSEFKRNTNNNIGKFLSINNLGETISQLATLCTEVSQRVYAEDLQAHLKAAGYKLGSVDGKWGPKSKLALDQYLSDNSYPKGTKVSYDLFQNIRFNLGQNAPSLKGISNTADFVQSTSLNDAELQNQFSFSEVSSKTVTNGEWVAIKLSFRDSTPVSPLGGTNTFRIRIDGNLKKGEFHAISLDDSFQIPKSLAYKGMIGKFYIAEHSVRDNSFRNLYNSLSLNNQTKLQGACEYIKAKVSDILKSEFKRNTNNNIGKFLSINNLGETISQLATLCTEVSQRVYAEDLQAHLKAAGYKLGSVDGKWGPKSKLALDQYLSDNSYPKGTKVSSDLFQNIRFNLGQNAPSLKGLSNTEEFFDSNGKLQYIRNLKEKLQIRRTINPFRAWHLDSKNIGYGLIWSSNVGNNPRSITLNTVNWNYYYPEKPVAGIEKYLTNKNWAHDKEYGKTLAIKILGNEYQDFIVNIMAQKIKDTKTDGLMLDWWHNHHQSSSGYSKHQVRLARTAIAKKLRNRIGPNKIIMGNVNWRKDTSTVDYINGVFLELYKEPFIPSSKRLYNSGELNRIEGLLSYYEQNLQEPKIIALEGWRKTKNVTDEDRNSSENRKMAKLLTAMSVVIPTNGYILYGDNNSDTPNGDHAHILYDFYSFDIGKPTSVYNKVKSGVGYKEHKKGFIAYNITGRSQTIKRTNGQDYLVEAKSGLFCKDVGKKVECLSNN